MEGNAEKIRVCLNLNWLQSDNFRSLHRVGIYYLLYTATPRRSEGENWLAIQLMQSEHKFDETHVLLKSA